MTDAIPKPDRPAKGQRWRYDGKERVRTFEICEVMGKAPFFLLRLRNVDGGDGRTVEWDRLRSKYAYLGDFSVPRGYTIHKAAERYHCFRDPFGYVEGAPRGKGWTWQQARDAAVEHAKTNSPGRRRKG